MNDGVSVLVALVLLVFIFRWLFGGATPTDNSSIRRAPVRDDWVQTVHSMFPHIPTAAIRRDLERTRSVEITCERILRDGQLPTLPSDFAPSHAVATPAAASTGASAGRPAATSQAAQPSLIRRFNLSDRNLDGVDDKTVDRVWEADSRKREDRLRSRKEQMLLRARKRMLEKRDTDTETTAAAEGKGKSPALE
ncbi:hypothetical protein THASP1DRAFT_31050 [Thamnocephalis sphaerospora]|uniref:CUE domain-containing protein n=1 Tax=Thamnocephalis sphaerospora TaxID=78915 RepID=A0A4V1IWD1_9FUNG|nr:hypothetical protein THASP1DRAFT_31050 [Thamnocephalis sphaerospora]|eukprot:RKP07139.1 hypothetical protein THASP1DRAFT_31050 [Thamnocephalis sphaerospora]